MAWSSPAACSGWLKTRLKRASWGELVTEGAEGSSARRVVYGLRRCGGRVSVRDGCVGRRGPVVKSEINFRFETARILEPCHAGAVARSRTAPARRLASPATGPTTGWQSDSRVVTLTRQINTLQRDAAVRVVNAVVAIGGRIAEVRARLLHGQWQHWIAEAVPFTPRTVTNYMALAAWADARPQEVERLASLGPSKLYLLAGLPLASRRRLTSSRAVVFSDGREKTVGLMTLSEFVEAIGEERGLAIAETRPPIGRVLGKMRHRIAGLEAIVEELGRRREEVGEEAALEMRNELVELVEALDGAFGL